MKQRLHILKKIAIAIIVAVYAFSPFLGTSIVKAAGDLRTTGVTFDTVNFTAFAEFNTLPLGKTYRFTISNNASGTDVVLTSGQRTATTNGAGIASASASWTRAQWQTPLGFDGDYYLVIAETVTSTGAQRLIASHSFTHNRTANYNPTWTESSATDPGTETTTGTLTAGINPADNRAKVTLVATGNTLPFSVVVEYGGSASSASGQSTTLTVGANGVQEYVIDGLQALTTYHYAVRDAVVTSHYYVQQTSFTTGATGTGYVLTPDGGTAPSCSGGADGYCLLAPVGGLTVIRDVDLKNYFTLIYKILIGAAGALAVIMIFWGGVQYMTTDTIGGKEYGKERIRNAIVGLILALSSYAILNTVNPDLLDFTFGVNKLELEYIPPGDLNGSLLTSTSGLFVPSQIVCPGAGGSPVVGDIVQSYLNKVTYIMGGKGSTGPSNTVAYDCSGFVNRVLQCAGLPYTANGTAGIFAGAEPVASPNDITATKVNGIDLVPGDLLGWPPGNGETYGHVVIFIGNGMIAESHGPANIVGKGVDTSTKHISRYKNRIKFIKRVQ